MAAHAAQGDFALQDDAAGDLVFGPLDFVVLRSVFTFSNSLRAISRASSMRSGSVVRAM